MGGLGGLGGLVSAGGVVIGEDSQLKRRPDRINPYLGLKLQ